VEADSYHQGMGCEQFNPIWVHDAAFGKTFATTTKVHLYFAQTIT
jgi:hypothetical protein